MRVKKKELRKREAQLPINYPAPSIEEPFDYNREKDRVENLCKRLAHNEVEIRDAVLAEIPRFLREVTQPLADLSASASVDEEDLASKKRSLEMIMMKLCIGLHYCFWHSDKPLVQHECAFKISQLLFAPVTNEFRMMFLRCFFRTLTREWSKIDHYRLDKYMALVRKVIFQMISFLSQMEKGEAVRPVVLKAEGPFISAVEEKKPAKKVAVKTASAKKRADDASAFGNILSEIRTLFQQDVLQNTTSVGLTMHLCDLSFDELTRANVSPDVFVAVARAIPCFAMSRGNYIEKRVLDNFFAPLTGGVLERRWDMEEREADILAVYRKMVEACREYSVDRLTVRTVRTMFSEAQLLLENKLLSLGDPELLITPRPADMRRRIEREVLEVNQQRLSLAKEKDGLRSLKRKERTHTMRKVRKAEEGGGEVDPRAAALARALEARQRKKAAQRGTKRNKLVKISKKDLAKE